MIPPKSLLTVLFLTIFLGVVFVARHGLQNGGRLQNVQDWIPGANSGKEYIGPCTEQLDWLEPYLFNYPINYASRDIVIVPSANAERPSVTTIDKPLFNDFHTIDLSKSKTAELAKCLPDLRLEVPRIPMLAPDASNMIFGLQTTIKRLKETVKHLGRWLSHSNARLYAIVIETEEVAANDEEMKALEKEFQDLGMNVTVMHPVRATDSFAQRYFSLVNLMYEHRDDTTEWVVCIDDDTFFPSMYNLLDMLSVYDATKSQYIGSLSEDWWAVNHYGLMGFGGAGVFISTPLAKTVHEHNDECKENLRTTAGDISVMDCIYRFTDTKLTHVPALHQVDMPGDLTGFYESGREFTSLHHWKNDFKLEMDKLHMVADICGSCFLQRYQFPNEYLLTNGFSITHYPQGHLTGKKPGGVLGTGVGGVSVDKIDLNQMEETWADKINVLHSLAPTRDKMPVELKVGYKLLDSIYVDGAWNQFNQRKRAVRQIYLKEGGEGERDTVIALTWHPAANQPVSALPGSTAG
ncbi:glycosyltransferase family 31 protein [Halenospora varia]|nr:glycosyltransferase family 31 protein [Halenospora varia]